MKKGGFTYWQIALIAITTELALIAIQFAYLKFSATESAFTIAYVKTRGFYVFQIIGFFLYTTIVFIIIRRIDTKILSKVLALVAIGGMLELSFYMLTTGYEGAFLYSILDKLIGAVFGIIVYNYTTNKAHTPGSYV